MPTKKRPEAMKPDTFRERALRLVDQLSLLEGRAAELAETTTRHGRNMARRALAEAAMNFTAAARTFGSRK